MKRWRMALLGGALACVSCGAAVIGTQTSTGPTVMRGASISTIDHASAQSGRSISNGAIAAEESNPAQAPSSSLQRPPAKAAGHPETAEPLPATVSSPCSRTGKPAPMCPVASP
jgi:hypothetical protein